MCLNNLYTKSIALAMFSRTSPARVRAFRVLWSAMVTLGWGCSFPLRNHPIVSCWFRRTWAENGWDMRTSSHGLSKQLWYYANKQRWNHKLQPMVCCSVQAATLPDSLNPQATKQRPSDASYSWAIRFTWQWKIQRWASSKHVLTLLVSQKIGDLELPNMTLAQCFSGCYTWLVFGSLNLYKCIQADIFPTMSTPAASFWVSNEGLVMLAPWRARSQHEQRKTYCRVGMWRTIPTPFSMGIPGS